MTEQEETGLSFGMALRELKEGEKLTRAGWNGKGQFVELQIPDKNSKMTLPYIYISTVDGELVMNQNLQDMLDSYSMLDERTRGEMMEFNRHMAAHKVIHNTRPPSKAPASRGSLFATYCFGPP